MPTQGNTSGHEGTGQGFTVKTTELYNQAFLDAAKEFNEHLASHINNSIYKMWRDRFPQEPDPIQEAAELYEWLENVT